MSARTVARWIEAVSWAFVLFGLVLPFAFFSPAFSIYRTAAAGWAYASPAIPAADENLLGLMLGITGGSIAGKWIVHALLARGPLAEGHAWARDLTVRGLACWFAVDSVASLAIGATFNVWMINLVPVALAGLPLFFSWSSFGDDAPPVAREPWSRTARACFWASLFGAATGLGIAFGGTTPLFALWFHGLEAAQYGGAALAPSTTRLALLFFGPIGGSTLAQFVMLAGWLSREPERRRVAIAAVFSIAGWFVIDSSYGLAHDGLFNVAMVNIPGAVVTLPPWLWAVYREGTRRD